jgi:uncharacterized coiled-coil DUF342 family protein
MELNEAISTLQVLDRQYQSVRTLLEVCQAAQEALTLSNNLKPSIDSLRQEYEKLQTTIKNAQLVHEAQKVKNVSDSEAQRKVLRAGYNKEHAEHENLVVNELESLKGLQRERDENVRLYDLDMLAQHAALEKAQAEVDSLKDQANELRTKIAKLALIAEEVK